MCGGTVCNEKGVTGVCLKGKCLPGVLAGEVSGSFGILGVPALDTDDNIKLLALCKNEGKIKEVTDVKYQSNKTGGPYPIPVVSPLDTICDGNGGLAGFYLGLEVNDETGGTGGQAWTKGMPWTAGTDDWHAIGQTAPGSHVAVLTCQWLFRKILFNGKLRSGEYSVLLRFCVCSNHCVYHCQ